MGDSHFSVDLMRTHSFVSVLQVLDPSLNSKPTTLLGLPIDFPDITTPGCFAL